MIQRHLEQQPKGKERRAQLCSRIHQLAIHVGVRVVDVREIDKRVQKKELNVLEREVAVELIESAPRSHRIIADGITLFGSLRERYPHLAAYNKAEEKHAAVAAASVVAKTRRDAIFEEIATRYRSTFGKIRGGGYVNSATRDFLRAYAQRHGELPPEARRSWPHPYLADIL